jgi:hypothetical protein
MDKDAAFLLLQGGFLRSSTSKVFKLIQRGFAGMFHDYSTRDRRPIGVLRGSDPSVETTNGSNVESTVSMIKAKFSDHVRSKTDVAMRNEALCKILCHNICVLNQEMYELGIEPTFWANDKGQIQGGIA